MDVIKLTRELGRAIQEDSDYITMQAAAQLNDEDAELQNLIESFNDIMSKAQSEEDLEDEELNGELQGAYDRVMNNMNMARFNAAKAKVDKKMNYIVSILAAAVNGEDPMTFEPQQEHDHGCGGNCGGCHGC